MSLSRQFENAIDIKVAYVLARLFQKHGLTDEHEEICPYSEAYVLGREYSYSVAVRHLFSGSPLEAAYMQGIEDYESMRDREGMSATQEEWDALSFEEQESQWDCFHDRCAEGTADEMYFYRVMMDIHLVNYVGH